MPQVLTDADIERLAAPKALTDADVASFESKPVAPATPSAQSIAHNAFVDAKAAHPNAPYKIEELNTTPPDTHEIDAFKQSHPYIYGAVKMLFNDATPYPGVMSVEGPLGAAVQSATKAGGQSAGQFISDVLSHPKTVQAMKDAALEWLKELPGVKATIKTAKGVGAVKEVIDDVLEKQANKPPVVPNAPESPGLRAPLRPPLEHNVPDPAPSDIGLHGGIENTSNVAPASTPIPEGADLIKRLQAILGVDKAPQTRATPIAENTDLTQKLQALLREAKIKGGFDPDQPLGQVKGGRYLNHFGSAEDSPVIDSTKRRAGSTVPVANPSLITKAAADKVGGKLAGVVSPEQFDKMVKNPQVRDIISTLAGQEADSKLLSAIRRRIAKNAGQAPDGYDLADLMKGMK